MNGCAIKDFTFVTCSELFSHFSWNVCRLICARPTDGNVKDYFGRRTIMLTTVVNSGVDHTVVAHVSQHCDVNTLQNYVEHSSSASSRVALPIARALRSGELVEGIDSDEGEDVGYEEEKGGYNQLRKRLKVTRA